MKHSDNNNDNNKTHYQNMCRLFFCQPERFKEITTHKEIQKWQRIMRDAGFYSPAVFCVCICDRCAHHVSQGAAIWTVVLACWRINSSRGYRLRRAKAWVTYTQGIALSLQMGAHHGPRRSWLPVTGGGGGRRGGGSTRVCGDRMGAVLFSPSSSTLEIWHHTCCWYHYCGIVGRWWHWLLAQLCK